MNDRDIWDELESASHGENLDEEMFEFISAYADGECSPKERRLVEAYLAESPAAREVLASLRSQSAVFASETPEPPDWLAEAILAKTVGRRRFAWQAAGVFATCGAAAAFLLAIVVADQPTFEQPDSPLVATNVDQTPKPELPIAAKRVAEHVPSEPVPAKRPIRRETEPRVERSSRMLGDSAKRPSAKPPLEDKPPARHVARPAAVKPPTTYAHIDSGKSDRAEPKQFDAIPAYGAESSSIEGASVPPQRVLPGAKQKLRDRIRKLNEQNKDIKEAIGSK